MTLLEGIWKSENLQKKTDFQNYILNLNWLYILILLYIIDIY